MSGPPVRRPGGPGGLAADLRLVARDWRWTHRPLVPRSAEPFVPDRARQEFPTGWARTRTAVAVREGVHRAALGPLLRAELRSQVAGVGLLGRVRPPVLFVANHASHLDTPLLLLALPPVWRRRTAVAAAADYFFDTWWRAVGSALLFNTFPIERRSGTLAATPGRLLAAGWNLVVFPEGTRSADGWPGRFRLGAAHLAVQARVPVVPVALRGTFAAMPRGRGWPAPGRPAVRVRFGDPLTPREGERTVDLSRRMQDGLARLLDEDRTSWWAAARRAADGATPTSDGPPTARWRRVWEAAASPVPPADRVWR